MSAGSTSAESLTQRVYFVNRGRMIFTRFSEFMKSENGLFGCVNDHFAHQLDRVSLR